MRLKKYYIACLFLAALTIGCSKDDDEVEVVPPRDRGEQEITDQEALEEYLDTHFYNYEEFENPSGSFDYQVRLNPIEGENADKIPLSESPALESKTVTFQDVDYTIYILKVQEGVGQQASFSDSTFVTYRGELLDGDQFDASNTPVWFDLVNTIPGFGRSLNEFKGASGYEMNPDNTIEWNKDFGIGTVFLPSGLGYFAETKPSIPAYSPLIFHVHMLAVNEADHDQDGVPTHLEDLNGDKILNNDDTDGDLTPNYYDRDDDADFTPTREEIHIDEEGNITLTDSDNDGTPDYLDESVY